MNTNERSGNPESLDKVLRQWRLDTPLPPRFQEQVWERIARAERKPEPAGWGGLSRLLGIVLPRPRFAYAYMGVLLALGIAGGAWAAQIKTNHMDAELSLRYVQSIDPYRAAAPYP